MNHIVRYYHGFVDEPEVLEEEDFETIEELLAIEWIAKWSHDSALKFVRYVKMGYMIAAECALDEKPKPYILGFMKDPDSINLPIIESLL